MQWAGALESQAPIIETWAQYCPCRSRWVGNSKVSSDPPSWRRSPDDRRRERLAENAAATQVVLSADEVADLNITAARIGVHGDRYNDLHMRLVDR